MPRGQVMKKLWEYIKEKGLQDEKNKRMINADENLLVIFKGVKQVSMFEMTKLVSAHLS
jgi:chromatin remodeling complex protein RSC6